MLGTVTFNLLGVKNLPDFCGGSFFLYVEEINLKINIFYLSM